MVLCFLGLITIWGGGDWRLPIEERACSKTDLGGGDYYLRNSGLPPSSGTVMYLGGAVVLLPPLGVPKIKIKRKLRLESNTWQWQRLRICLNSLLIQEKSFSLLKRILHYTRCTMTESRLNDLALTALHPIMLSELSTEKKHWNVCASKSQKIVA